ncbi:MAG: SpoIVB peptidase S55 domain-containing protein [Christensenellales bacterium]
MKKFYRLTVFFTVLALFCCCFGTVYAETDEVYLGGKAIGIVLESDGFVICGKNDVITDKGIVTPAENLEIIPGDILTEIDGKTVSSLEDVKNALDSAGESVIIGIKRNGTIIRMNLVPAVDSLTKSKRLGLCIKKDVSGIGTLTYIKKDGRFGALGHPIKDENGAGGEMTGGTIYNCSILSVQKGVVGSPGQLNGIFVKENPIGRIDNNNCYGIYGQTDSVWKTTVKLGGADKAKVGKAYIYSTVSGDTVERFEIEIVKKHDQKNAADKGMVIRVTDKKLIARTGGILQGMSGSPIVQNGYLIGAVTHVLVNDPTGGYGIYIDWMINN